MSTDADERYDHRFREAAPFGEVCEICGAASSSMAGIGQCKGPRTAQVVDLPVVTSIPGDPDRFLDAAKGKLTEVVIIGYTKEGKEYFASSQPDGGACLWHLVRAQKKLTEVPETHFGH